MKNSIIFLLSLALCYFILNALGTFNFGSLIEHDSRAIYAKERNIAVSTAAQFKIGLVCNPDNGAVKIQVEGMQKAVDDLNAKGGISGKPVTLIIKRASNLAEHNQALQELCKQRDVAVCIGPFSSDYIPSMRSLSQFQALPLVSSCTVFPDTLPELSPENYITFFPALKEWSSSIIDHIKEAGHKDLVLISPNGNSYGSIFATELERESRQKSVYNNIYRINYQTPFNRDSFSRILHHYSGKHFSDVIVFTGEYTDFMVFCKLAKECKIKQSLYGTDDLNVEELATNLDELPSTLYLPYAVYGEEKSHQMSRLGYVTIAAIAKCVTAKGGYHAESLVKDLYAYKASEEYKEDNPVEIQIEEVNEATATSCLK